jgi:hypothetical protein
MDDESHPRLRIALELLLNQNYRWRPFQQAARFGSIASGLQIVGETSRFHSKSRFAAQSV